METKHFYLMLAIILSSLELCGQDSMSVSRPKRIHFEYELPDTVNSGFFCLVFYSHSNRSKYHISILDYHSEIEFTNVKKHRDSLRILTTSSWRKLVSPLFFHPAHPLKAYLMVPIDSLATDQVFAVTIERKRLFGLIRQEGYCEATYQPERIYLVLGPHGFNRYSCNWAGNLRSGAP